MRKRCRTMLALLRGQMNDWLHSPRTIIMGLVILAMTYTNALSFNDLLKSNILLAYTGEALFVYLRSGFGNMLVTSAFFLIMISEMPRRIAFQHDMLMRTTRAKWLWSQVLFCFTVVALMMALMTVFSMLLTSPYLSPGSGWSDLERIAADPDAAFEMQLVAEYIRAIPPWQANLWAGAILFCFWFTMVLVILSCSLAGKANFGLILYVFLLVLHITILWENLPPALRQMPTWYATISGIASLYPDHELESVPIVLTVYAALDLCLIGVMRLQVRAMDMRFSGKDEA